jgi:hypothetical protein
VKALVLAIVLNAGCAVAPVDEAVEYERADARLKAIEQFQLLRKACRASGGVIYIEESWGRLKPTPIDLRTVRCASTMIPMPRVRR